MNRDWLNFTGSAVAVLLTLLLGFALWSLVHFDVRADNHDILLVVITFLTDSLKEGQFAWAAWAEPRLEAEQR